MDEKRCEEWLKDVLDCDDNEYTEEVKSVYSFEDAGVLTRNKGIVLQMKDGSSFQITIVRRD